MAQETVRLAEYAAALRYVIIKQGHTPSSCRYDIKVINKPGWEAVPG